MALALPLLIAGGGYLGFGPIGAAVGWLVGAWLFGPKAQTENQIFDPGAQEMPRFNQSLRGVTMAVMFGTNRVASNVVWTNNFQTIRKETSSPQQGGGKGMGSGGGGKGGGQATSTQVSYEYKWDLLYHMGMTPEPYGLFGGWSNMQRISGDTLSAIVANAQGMPVLGNTGGSRVSTFNITSSNSKVQDTDNIAVLTFDGSFYSVGGETNGNYDAWDYFEAQTGSACRWPYTVYVGFQSLSLGSSPNVPQLEFEIGPGTAVVTRSPIFLGHADHSNYRGFTNCIMKGADGNHWFSIAPDGTTGDNNDLLLWCIETNATLVGHSSALPTGTVGAISSSIILPWGGTKYVAHVGVAAPGGANFEYRVNIYEITAAGTLSLVTQFYESTTGGITEEFSSQLNVKSYAYMSFDGIEKTDTGYPAWVISRTTFGHHRIMLWLFPRSADPVAGVTLYPDPQNYVNFGLCPISLEDEGVLDVTDGTGNPYQQNNAFLLPWYDPHNRPTTNNKWPVGYYLCIYVSPGQIRHANDIGQPSSAIISTFGPANPGGFIAGYRITGRAKATGFLNDLEVEGPLLLNSLFEDDQGQPFTSFFDDSEMNIDGSTNTNNQYKVSGVTTLHNGSNAGGVVVTFTKDFQNFNTDLFPNQGSYVKHKVFAWNPASGKAKLYTDSEGTWVTNTDVGKTLTLGSQNLSYTQNTFFDEDDGNFYIVGTYSGFNTFATAFGSTNGQTFGCIWGPMSFGGGSDVPIAYIIYNILTNAVFGAGVSTLEIDQTTYTAALQYCRAYNLNVSVVYTREESLLSAIEDLLAIMGGYLIDSGGSVRFGIQQQSTASVRVIDNDHLVPEKQGAAPVKVTKGALVDGFNKVRVNYLDRNLDYRQNQVEVGDEVDQDINGVRFKEFPPKFVMNADLAQSTAERALWTNLYARDTYEFNLGWKDADLEPGDVITLVDSFHPELQSGKKVRIAYWHEAQRGKFMVRGVQEVAYYMSAAHSFSYVNSAVTSKGRNVEVLPCSDFRAYELPREFQASGAMLYFGYNQQSAIRGATLWLSPDGVTYSIATNAEPYIISGIFPDAIHAQDPGECARDVEIYILPASGFTVASPTFCQTLALDDVTAETRAAGGGLLYCGSEMLAMENLTLLGQNHYRVGKLYRGWGGTMPQAHVAMSKWHRHGSGIFMQEINTDKIGTTIHYKIVPYNFAGAAYDVSSVAAQTYTIKGSYWLPQAQSDLRVYIQDPLDGANSVDMRGNYYRAVLSGGTDVTIQWKDTARLEGYGVGGFGKLAYGHFTADADTHQWRVEVLRSDIVVRSTVVSSPSYTYTKLQNSGDFGGFSAEMQFRVTPFNTYGDAPFGVVRSLHCFSGQLAPHGTRWSATTISFDSRAITWDQR